MTLGEAIKFIRIGRKRKQVDLAEELGVSPNYLSLLEKDKREPSVAFLRRLADALAVPVSLFFLYRDLAQAEPKSALTEIAELLMRLQAEMPATRRRRTRAKRRAA